MRGPRPTGVIATEFLDAFLGAFLGVWASSPGLWAGPVPVGTLLVVLLAFLALYLQALRVAVEAPEGSLARGMHPAVLVGLGVQIVVVIALGAYSHRVSWPVNLGYGTIMVVWTASVYARPWLRRVATVLESVRIVDEAAAASEPGLGGDRRE